MFTKVFAARTLPSFYKITCEHTKPGRRVFRTNFLGVFLENYARVSDL